MNQRKKPVQRAFTGMAGSPLASVDESVAPQQPSGPPVAVVANGCVSGWMRAVKQKVWDDNRAANAFRLPVWSDVAKSAGIHPDQKCVHGHYLYEFYCDVCRLAPVDPTYDPDIYRAEITKALKQSRKSLTGDEGLKDLKDLNQIVDIEIWRASKKYGSAMNEALAYSIARNQAGKYLEARIEEQIIEFTDAEGNATRVPRFVSIDNRPQFEDGAEGTSAPELAVIHSPKQGVEDGFTAEDIESLRALVAKWHGTKRQVAEAMLLPGFSTRNVPGVPKSTADRARQVILREFKSFKDKGL
jgi:hypothetical protein